MPASDHDSLPDVAIGHHPDFGIVAANPKQLVASAWMLTRLDFQPVPGHPTLYALSDQHRDGPARAVRAAALLRRINYQVDVDVALDPSPPPAPDRPHRPRPGRAPDVAFAEHPHLGVVAATDEYSSAIGSLILEEHGWRHNSSLDIYTLPITIDRDNALGKVAAATVSMHRSDLQVAVQPRLAQDVATRHTARPEHRHSVTTHVLAPHAAALGTSPARAGLPGHVSTAVPVASAPAPRPVDPRSAFSLNR
ncbi:hypothetical protein OIB37_11050 [Streptomyces sp. NBC_00820]|uniref:hypothetical protein n=1 Tax=Streptomyces sp. NBC_00820 TaxID=2975842 RepID=UPI002ED658D9|nr:hypothetical protein OIB37_11050 [Streptomyces sp. NBC_00820]